MSNIDKMLNPETIALIGATDREHSIGRSLLENLLKYEKGKVFPVNPKKESVFGLKCFSSIRDIEERVNLAVIATPMQDATRIIEESGKSGVQGAVIISANLKGTYNEWKIQEKEILHIGKRYGMRIMGPNCMGIVRPHIGLCATFLKTNLLPGNVAFISQSGILGDAILDWGTDSGIGFSMFASLGSMIDVGFGDIIDFLYDDFNTKSIMIYMENVGDARRFVSAARAFCHTRPIIVFKPGYFPDSSDILVSHRGVKTGEDRVYDAIFKRVGAVRVRKVADIFNAAEVLGSAHLPLGPGLAIITNAGGAGIIAVDNLFELGGKLARLSDKSISELNSLLPQDWSKKNPVHMLRDADNERYSRTIDICVKDPGVDGVLVIYTHRAFADPIGLAKIVAEKSHNTKKPVIAAWIGGELAKQGRQLLLKNNVPAYETPEAAVETYFYMYKYHRNIQLLYETPTEITTIEPDLKNQLKDIVFKAIEGKKSILPFNQSMLLLKSYGISVADRFFKNVTSEDRIISPDYNIRLQLKRDKDFCSYILLGSENKDCRSATPGVVGLPPLNETLVKRLIEEMDIYSDLKNSSIEYPSLIERFIRMVLNFSNLIVDFPEIIDIDLAPVIISRGNIKVLGAVISVDLKCSGTSHGSHLVIAPYPERYASIWTLPDGTKVNLRPIRPEDEPLWQEMLNSLSEETLRTRFFRPLKITHQFLVKFCNIDYEREIAILAEIKYDGRKKIIGGGRIAIYPDLNIAEFGITVHDNYQRRGLGRKIMEMMIDIAREKGLKEIHGTVLTDNKKIVNLCKKLGFNQKWLPDGLSELILTIQ